MIWLTAALGFLKKIPGWAWAALGVLAALLLAYLKGGSAARRDAKAKADKATLEEVARVREAVDERAGDSTDEKRARLKKRVGS